MKSCISAQNVWDHQLHLSCERAHTLFCNIFKLASKSWALIQKHLSGLSHYVSCIMSSICSFLLISYTCFCYRQKEQCTLNQPLFYDSYTPQVTLALLDMNNWPEHSQQDCVLAQAIQNLRFCIFGFRPKPQSRTWFFQVQAIKTDHVSITYR